VRIGPRSGVCPRICRARSRCFAAVRTHPPGSKSAQGLLALAQTPDRVRQPSRMLHAQFSSHQNHSTPRQAHCAPRPIAGASDTFSQLRDRFRPLTVFRQTLPSSSPGSASPGIGLRMSRTGRESPACGSPFANRSTHFRQEPAARAIGRRTGQCSQKSRHHLPE